MHARSALSLVQELLVSLEDCGTIFASPEDTDYFRKKTKKLVAPKSIVPPPVVLPKPTPPKVEVAPPLPPLVVVKKPEPVPQIAPPPPPPIELPVVNFSELRKILAKTSPELLVIDEIPSDEIARKIASRWKTKNKAAPISILAFQEPPEQKALLQEIAKAIDVYFGPAQIISAETIEKDKQWGAFLSVAELKWVIACDYTLWQLNGLMSFYKENPTEGTRTLGAASGKGVPLFLLPDLTLYLKDPLLKRSLWKALCLKLS